MNALIGQLDQSVLLVELNAKIHSELQKNAELQHEIEKRDIQLNETALQLRDMESQLEQLKQHSGEQAQPVLELEQRLNAIYASSSWKLMGPVRRIGRALGTDKKSGPQDSDS